jgi:hypothetical protein
MLTCHRGDFIPSHGPTRDVSLGDAQAIHHTAKVFRERGRVLRFFCFGLTVSPASIRNDPESVSERRRKVVENVRVVTATMNKNHHRAAATPIQVMETNAVRDNEATLVRGSV